MATNLLSFRPVRIVASASSDNRKPDPDRRRTSSASGWWTPLFGWSSEPDYIEKSAATGSNPDPRSASGRYAPGCFTAEKAKQLRMMTGGGAAFHDVMYHSAIASRLASDFGTSSGGDL